MIEQLADPARDGWTFAGWYADAELALPWDFAEDAVDGPTTLHAKWTEKAQPEEPGGGGEDDPEGDSGKDPADDEGRDPDEGPSDGNDGSGASSDGDGTRKGSLARTGDSGILLASGAVAFAVASGAAAWAAARARRR